jgi:hypothetical protein
MEAATGEKERGGEMVCQVSKVAAAILTQRTSQLAELRSGMMAQFDFLRPEFGSCAPSKRICGTQDLIEERKGQSGYARMT